MVLREGLELFAVSRPVPIDGFATVCFLEDLPLYFNAEEDDENDQLH